MHGWAPPTTGVNFVVLGRPVGEGSTEAQRWLTALGRVSPARRWRSSVVEALVRRTRVACSGIVHGVGVPWTIPGSGWVGPIGLAGKKEFGTSDKEALTTSDGRSRLTASKGWASLADGKHRSPPGDQHRRLTWDQGYAARRIASPTSREKRNPELRGLSQHPMGDFETQDIERVSLSRWGEKVWG